MRLFAAVLFVAVSAGTAVSQTRILVYEFEPRGVEPQVVAMVDQLLKDEFNGSYRFVVVEPPSGTNCYNVVAAAESARVYGAAKAFVGNAMQLGGKTFVTYQLVDAATSTVELADRVELPPVEEYPMMAKRIVASVVQKVPYAETIEPEQVTQPEVAPRFKHPRKPYASIFLTAGYLYHLRRRSHPGPEEDFFSNSLVNLNVATTFETQNLLTMLQLGLLRGVHEESDISFDLMGHYVFGKGDFAPMVGGGVGITRFSWKENNVVEHNDGLNLSAGVGMIGLRTYYFRLVAAAYANYTLASNDWGGVPGVKVLFGVTTPTLGPDATVKMPTGCIGAAIGGFFLTGLVLALVS